VIQYALDVAYKSRFGRSAEQIRSDLIAKFIGGRGLRRRNESEWTSSAMHAHGAVPRDLR
jgi:hypothetical protein